MALHSMQRVATSAKHKTKASIKKVLWNCSPVSPLEATSSGIEEIEAAREAAAFHAGRKVDYESSSPRSATSDSDFSDEEGYFTASDGHLESDDSDLEYHSDDTHDAQDASPSHDGPDSPSKSVFPRDSATDSSGPAEYEGESVSSQVERLRTSIDKLRVALHDLESEDLLEEVDDADLLRFLIARNCVIAKAADMFIKDWRWRKSFAPNGTMPEDVITSQLESEKAFLQGIDKHGRPLLILQGSRHFAKRGGLEEFKRYCFYCIEKVVACIPQGKDKFVTIIDLAGTSYKNMDIGGTKMMVNLLQAHYPERMGQLFVLHASPVIQMPYRLVEPAIDVKTREKIMFWGDEDIDTLLLEHIGDEILPPLYGGKAEFIPLQYSKVDSTRFPSRAVRSH